MSKHFFKEGAEKHEIKSFTKRYGAKGKKIYFEVLGKLIKKRDKLRRRKIKI